MAPQIQCACAYCRDAHEFDIDPFLIQEIVAQNVVVFAGAGVSTENRLSMPHTLYTEMAVELGAKAKDLPFPDLAEQYAGRPDGRRKLLALVQKRFDYIEKFRDLRDNAKRFHRTVATMPYLDTFVTTNWDRYFEDVCKAKPFVYDADIGFWSLAKRRVLKIHGTIDDYSSIVATRADYTESTDRLAKSLIGGKLKELLATKTCIFVGYSMTDDDFKEIFAFVRKAQGKFEKTHYFVSPFIDPASPLPAGVIGIKTDGSYFFKNIKEHMCENYCFLPDVIFDDMEELLEEVRREHHDFVEQHDPKMKPQVLLACSYQDGLIHGFELLLDKKWSGESSDLHSLQGRIHLYTDKIKDYRAKKAYLDVAYFQGFQNALISVVLAERKTRVLGPPPYYHEGVGEMSRSAYRRQINKLPDLHKASFRYCEKAVSKWSPKSGIVFQHPPWG